MAAALLGSENVEMICLERSFEIVSGMMGDIARTTVRDGASEDRLLPSLRSLRDTRVHIAQRSICGTNISYSP
jgi:hypothetical protein